MTRHSSIGFFPGTRFPETFFPGIVFPKSCAIFFSLLLVGCFGLTPVQGQEKSESQSDSKTSTQTEEIVKTEITAEKNNIEDLTFDDVQFEMEDGVDFKREMLTEKILGYDQQMIRLRGYIRPSFRQTGLKKFVFVRDNKECCFGPGAAIFDCVLVRLAKGEETAFTVRPVTIEGRFFLKEYVGPDKNVWAIYQMKDGIVK